MAYTRFHLLTFWRRKHLIGDIESKRSRQRNQGHAAHRGDCGASAHNGVLDGLEDAANHVLVSVSSTSRQFGLQSFTH